MADIGTQFTIIALGSPELLVNVLNGLAMMGSDGTLKGLAKVAALGGLLSMIVSSIISQRHEYYKMLTAFVLYSILFGTTATVKVESLYTGEITPVAHVPIGIAMPMAMATTIGNKLTKEMETVFSIPGVTLKDGGVDALGWLARSHDLAIPDPKLSMTVAAYVRDCVLTSINSTVPEPDQITLDGWQTATDLLVTMGRANYAAISTVTYLAGDLEGGQVRSCAAAYDAFQPAMLAAMVDINVQKQLGAQLGMHISDNSGTPVTDKLAAVKTTIDKAAGGAQLYMQNALIQNEFRCQTAGVGDASCITLTEGSEKRRAQWASEQSFFKQIARPLMAFAEAYLPAMAPMMLVVLLIAPGSMAVVGTYFKLVASLALWTPLMALINFYLTSSVSGHLGNIAAAIDPNSVAYMSSTWTTIADYVSVGGMMYASVPMLAYGIVSGTGGLSSALGSRAQAASGGADASNTMAPALAQTGAVVSHGAGMQTAPGLTRSAMGAEAPDGALQAMGAATVSVSNSRGTEQMSAAQQSLATAQSSQRQAQVAQSAAVDKTISDAATRGFSHAEGAEFAKNFGATESSIQSLAKQHSWGADKTQAARASMEASIGGSFFGGTGAKAALAKSLGINEKEAESLQTAAKSDVGTQQGAAAARKSSDQWNSGSDHRNSTSFKAAQQATATVTAADQQVNQAQQSYSAAAKQSQSSEMSTQFAGSDLLNRASADGAFQRGLVNGARRLDTAQYGTELKTAQGFGMRGASAETAAALATYAKGGAAGQQELTSVMGMHGVTSAQQTAPVGSVTQAGQNAGVNAGVAFRSPEQASSDRTTAEAGASTARSTGAVGAGTQPATHLPAPGGESTTPAAPAARPRSSAAHPGRALAKHQAATQPYGAGAADAAGAENKARVAAAHAGHHFDPSVSKFQAGAEAKAGGGAIADGQHATLTNAAIGVARGTAREVVTDVHAVDNFLTGKKK